MVDTNVRKLFLEANEAYNEQLHRPFTPFKVQMHPFPHEIQPRPASKSSIPKSASLDALPRIKAAVHLPEVAATPSRTPVKRQSILQRATEACQHFSNEAVLEEMRAFVAKKQSERKATTPPEAKIKSARTKSRGIEVNMQCQLEFNHLHNRATRRLNVNPDPDTSFGTDLEVHHRASPFKSSLKETSEGRKKKKESLSYQKLLRKLSPTITNSATTYINLLHLLQACRVCGSRVTFCSACQTRANEYFNTFSPAELEKMYGKQLPKADDAKVNEYASYLLQRELLTVHKGIPIDDEDR